MRKTKTVASLLIAGTLLAGSVSLPAFATTTNAKGDTVSDVAATTDGSITGLSKGDTVSIIKIADSYLVGNNDLKYDFVTGVPSAYDSAAKLGAITSDGYSYSSGKSNKNATDAQTAANEIASALSGNTPVKTVTADDNGKADISGLDSGYYLVEIKSSANGSKVFQNILLDATPDKNGLEYKTRSIVDIAAKAEPVSVTKTVDTSATDSTQAESTDHYAKGESAKFTVTSNVPAYPKKATKAKFIITDTPTGLKIDTSTIKIDVAGSTPTEGTDYEITAAETGYEISFKSDYILAHPNDAVTVTYTAEIDAPNAETGQTKNDVKVTYSTNPYEDSDSESDDTVIDKTYGYVFQKLLGTAHEVGTGAEFTLYDEDGTNVRAIDGKSVYTADANGYVTIDGLPAGTYTLKETKTPSGYQPIDDFTFTVDGDTATGDNPATDTTESNFVVASDAKVDPDQPVLPVTGGTGTVVIALAAMACAITAVIVRRRGKQDKDEE